VSVLQKTQIRTILIKIKVYLGSLVLALAAARVGSTALRYQGEDGLCHVRDHAGVIICSHHHTARLFTLRRLLWSINSVINLKDNVHKLVLFKSLRNCKRHNNRNFTLKSNSNKIKLCGGSRQHYLVLNKISTL
jgi:hypothetical protein